MMRSIQWKLNILMFFVMIIAAAGCDNKSDSSPQTSATTSLTAEFSVTGVNDDYTFLIHEAEAGGMINFNSAELKQCGLSFIKEKFIQGYTTRITKLGEGDIDLTCLAEKDHFAMNDSGLTYVEMTVTELNSKAVVLLNFSLYGIKSKSLLTRENVKLELNKAQLKSLLRP